MADGIKFKATEAWSATVSELAVRASSPEPWLRLSSDAGPAGDISLSLELDKNETGKDRKAEIRIQCGSTTILITIEQKATPNPDPEPPVDATRLVAKITYHYQDKGSEAASTEVTTFTYDTKGRTIGAQTTLNNLPESRFKDTHTWEYNDGTIIYKNDFAEGSTSPSKSHTIQETTTITSNTDGTVKSIASSSVSKSDGSITGSIQHQSQITYTAGYMSALYTKTEEQWGESSTIASSTRQIQRDAQGNIIKSYDPNDDRYYQTFTPLTQPYDKPCNINFSALLNMELSTITLNLGKKESSLCSQTNEIYKSTQSDSEGNTQTTTQKDTYDYTYEYDAKGYVTKLTITAHYDLPLSSKSVVGAPFSTARRMHRSNGDSTATRGAESNTSTVVYTIQYKD